MEGTTNVPSWTGDDIIKFPNISSSFFYINFWNIRGLESKIISVEYNLNPKSHLLFLTDPQEYETTDSYPYLFVSYFFTLSFTPNLAVAAIYTMPSLALMQLLLSSMTICMITAFLRSLIACLLPSSILHSCCTRPTYFHPYFVQLTNVS